MNTLSHATNHAIYRGHIVGREVLRDSSRFQNDQLVLRPGFENKYKNNPTLEDRIEEVKTFLGTLQKQVYGRYWKLVDPLTGKDVVAIVPCHDVTMKAPVAFVYDTKYNFYEMVSLVMDESYLKRRFTNDPGYEVNVVFFVFDTCFQGEYEYVCGGIKGARLKEEQTIGLFTFGVESVVLCRAWTTPKARTTAMQYRHKTYHLEEPAAAWYHPITEEEEAGDNGYMTFVHSILPRIYQCHTVAADKRRVVLD